MARVYEYIQFDGYDPITQADDSNARLDRLEKMMTSHTDKVDRMADVFGARMSALEGDYILNSKNQCLPTNYFIIIRNLYYCNHLHMYMYSRTMTIIEY